MRLRVRTPAVPGLLPGTSLAGVLVSAVLHLLLGAGIAVLASLKPTPPPLGPVYTVALVEEALPGAGSRAAAAPAVPQPVPETTPPAEAVPPPKEEPKQAKQPPPEVKAKPKPRPKPETTPPRDPRPEPEMPGAQTESPTPSTPDGLPAGAAAPPRTAPATGGSVPGAGLVAGGPGDLGGVPSIDSEAFPFLYYRQILTNRLSSTWSRPVVPGGLPSALRATVRFEILRGGALSDVALVTSSGYPALDRSALRAVLDANPLPPLPEQFAGDRLAVHFYFELVPEARQP